MLWSHLLLFVVFFDQPKREAKKVEAKGWGTLRWNFFDSSLLILSMDYSLGKTRILPPVLYFLS